jgi:hypothetical protein
MRRCIVKPMNETNETAQVLCFGRGSGLAYSGLVYSGLAYSRLLCSMKEYYTYYLCYSSRASYGRYN